MQVIGVFEILIYYFMDLWPGWHNPYDGPDLLLKDFDCSTLITCPLCKALNNNLPEIEV